MSRTGWARARVVGGAAILAVLVWRLGATAFLAGLRTLDVGVLAAAAGIAVVTTAAAAWRWCVVARRLDLALPLLPAIAAYYRSQFLNTALPGGVLGDVHRAARHGRDVGDIGRGARAVVWERCAGQVVQLALALIVLVAVPSPVRSAMPFVVAVLLAGGVGAALALRAMPGRAGSRRSRILRTARNDLRDLRSGRAWGGMLLASVVVVAGHVAIFLIAARTAGSSESTLRLLPLAMLVMVAMGLPTNIGGWGPREGVAAWAFAAAGLGAAQGIATATVYGVMGIGGSLPGAAVLVVAWFRSRDRVARDRWREGAVYG
jgi:glycosyltransferase 2 family protein